MNRLKGCICVTCQGLSPGFTLLEVMVSLAILATAFAAVLRLHADSIEAVIASRVHTKAAELAQYKMTEIGVSGLKNLHIMSGDFGDIAPEYSWNVTIGPTPLDLWTKVTVSVSNKNEGKGAAIQLRGYFLSEKAEKPERESAHDT